MNLYLLRHGETDWNREGRLQGRTDIPLNRTGREQVGLAADALAKLHPAITLILSSPLKRAWESARITADRLADRTDSSHSGGLTILTEPLLTERCYGAGEGMTADERAAKYPDGIYPGMESRDELLTRSALAFERILEMAGNHSNILVASHGSILRGIVTVVTSNTPAARSWEIFGNGSIHLLCCKAAGQLRVETVFAGSQTEAFAGKNGNLY